MLDEKRRQLRKARRAAVVVASFALVLSLVVPGAQGAFSGATGKIAFVTTRDGTLATDITTDSEIYVMNS